MPRLARHADLRVLLESADARPCPARGSMMTNGRSSGSTIPAGGLICTKRVIRGPFEPAGVRDHLPLEVQERRLAGLLVLQPVVAALAQRVPEQDRALHEVEAIGLRVPPEIQRRGCPCLLEPCRARSVSSRLQYRSHADEHRP